MIHSEFRDHVDEWLDDVLPPEEAGRLEAHAAECADCAAELASARAFHDLLVDRGATALENWAAHDLAARVERDVARDVEREQPAARTRPEAAAPSAPAASAPAASAPAASAPAVSASAARTVPAAKRPWAPRILAYGAAPALAASLLAVAVLGLGDTGPRALAVGVTEQLAPGERALAGEGREVEADEIATLKIRPGTAGSVIALSRGSATFRLDEDIELQLRTPRGAAAAEGATFFVHVLPDDSVRMSVLSGDLRFTDRAGKQHALGAGEQLGTDTRGRVHLASVDRVRDHEVLSNMQSLENYDLRGRVNRLEEELATVRLAAERSADEIARTSPEVDEGRITATLPWDEFGKAARQLLPGRSGNRGSHERSPADNRALGLLLIHAEEIQRLTGTSNPVDSVLHPRFVQGIAPSFFRALAPVADEVQVDAAATETRASAEQALELVEGDGGPMSRSLGRLQLVREMIAIAQIHLGDEVAAELADSVGGRHGVLFAKPLRGEPGKAVTHVTQAWGKRFDLTESQRDALWPLVERYIEQTQAAQRQVSLRLGEARAREILAPSRSRRREKEPERTAAERIERRLATLDAKLEVARPRIELERAANELLRTDQVQRWSHYSWALYTFPEPSAE